jgi:hypothetical protein
LLSKTGLKEKLTKITNKWRDWEFITNEEKITIDTLLFYNENEIDKNILFSQLKLKVYYLELKFMTNNELINTINRNYISTLSCKNLFEINNDNFENCILIKLAVIKKNLLENVSKII